MTDFKLCQICLVIFIVVGAVDTFHKNVCHNHSSQVSMLIATLTLGNCDCDINFFEMCQHYHWLMFDDNACELTYCTHKQRPLTSGPDFKCEI